MGFDIIINANKQFSLQTLLSDLNNPKIKIGYSDLSDIESNLDGYLNLYLDQESTRGVTIHTTSDDHTVIINALASEEDHLLAIELATKLALLSESDILPESEEAPLSLTDFESKYNSKWVHEVKSSTAVMTKSMITRESSTITLPCCVRSVALGPETIARFDNLSGEQLYNSICNLIKRIQYLDKSKVRIPQLAQLEESKETLFIYNREEVQFVPKVDYVYIDDGGIYKIPYANFVNSKSIDLERLDENQYIATLQSSTDFDRLKEEHQQYSQSTARKNAPQKKWWKFW